MLKFFKYKICRDIYGDWVKDIYHTGSTAICTPPPPVDTDVDFILLSAPMNLVHVEEAEWSCQMGEEYLMGPNKIPYDNKFFSFKKTDSETGDLINLIITQDAEFFKRFKIATKVARTLNVTNKTSRCALFEAILTGGMILPYQQEGVVFG